MQETRILSLSQEKISWSRKWQSTPVFLPGKNSETEEPGGLQPMGSQRVGHDLASEQQHQNHTGGLGAASYRRLLKQTTVIGEQGVVDCPAVYPAVREECGEDKK